MSLSRSRLLASSLAAAAAISIGALAYTTLPRGDASAPAAEALAAPVVRTGAASDTAERAAPERNEGVRVEAPNAQVNVDKDRGKVSVQAPYTDVNVDPDKGRVRVRAPYVNLDIRW